MDWNTPEYESGATDTATVPGNGNWMAWDVTSDVQSFASGSDNYGWLIKDSPEGAMAYSLFKTKEHADTDYHPVLEVTYIP